MLAFTACGCFDTDGDGYTDDFEERNSDWLDKDTYNWNVPNEELNP